MCSSKPVSGDSYNRAAEKPFSGDGSAGATKKPVSGDSYNGAAEKPFSGDSYVGATKKPLLGLDLGEKRIGVALSDAGGTLAFPHSVIKSQGSERDIATILSLAQKHGVGLMVVGLPISLNGSIGPQAQRVQAFVDVLRQHPVPVETWDESFSSTEAERLLQEAGAKDKSKIDALAAALVLQGYLDSHRS